MIMREVTIGRSKDCDIYLDERCIYASSHHATIYYDGNQLMYRDNSSNGTLINNVSVKHRAVPIRHGGSIIAA
jgi:pSer/pThr/pTyr-binding forkhead associated (FHA) protein